jgi:hypothetical protein
MKDLRFEKRINSFFKTNDIKDISKKREDYILKLRKEKLFDNFMEKRRITQPSNT